MRFLIISHSKHKRKDRLLYGYAPYVNEMNLWLKHVDEVEVVAPEIFSSITTIETEYKHDSLNFEPVDSIVFTSFKNAFISMFSIPKICFKLFRACKKADHIHLRCPGNIGLLGCLVQMFFPKKPKTAKYAGNWDPDATQPISYRFQKWVLSNTFLTKNMNVLVYGNWKNQTKNIKPFFTASYFKDDCQTIKTRDYSGVLKFVFVGSLIEGKRPLLAIQIIENLSKLGYDVTLDLYGDGILKPDLNNYIDQNELNSIIELHGNQSKETVKLALKASHFLILLSRSEGWPKAIAEAMFFGAIPISTSVSCIPYMLDYGNRGVLLPSELNEATNVLREYFNDSERLKLMSSKAAKWSQEYTLDTFEDEIIKIL